jgi:hypothetical protein
VKGHILSEQGLYEGLIEAGLRLAALPESEGGWKEYFDESDAADLRIQDDILRAQTALMLENAKRWLAQKCKARRDSKTGRLVIDEVTRSALVGGWSDYLFPIIRASFPTNPINDLVSVQPTNRRTATVVYWNWIVATQKGSYYPGQRLQDANKGRVDAGYHFSDEWIMGEVVGVGTGASAVIAGTLAFHDGGGVRPGTVAVTAVVGATPETVYDDGNGGFTGGVTGTINYVTGAFSITFSGNVDVSTNVVANYKWDSEGGNLPEVDVQIVSSTVETQRRGLKVNYSMEAMQDIMAEFGVSLEGNLVSGAAEQINFEIARQLIAEMWAVAPINSTFPTTLAGTPGYNQQDHFKDLSYNLNAASNSIWAATQKGYGNWIVIDELASNVVESLPAGMFVAAPRPANVQGLHFIGTLLNKYRVYKDIHLTGLPGSSANGNMLMGYKGRQFYEAGLVWAPYQLLYTTESLQTADFLTQKGMASRYATKMVNNEMYVRVNLGP